MTKRKIKHDKQLAKLRRENEILRAQLSKTKQETIPEPLSKEVTQKEIPEEEFVSSTSTARHLKADLSKTFYLTAFLIFLLSILYYTQPQWPRVVNYILSKF